MGGVSCNFFFGRFDLKIHSHFSQVAVRACPQAERWTFHSQRKAVQFFNRHRASAAVVVEGVPFRRPEQRIKEIDYLPEELFAYL